MKREMYVTYPSAKASDHGSKNPRIADVRITNVFLFAVEMSEEALLMDGKPASYQAWLNNHMECWISQISNESGNGVLLVILFHETLHRSFSPETHRAWFDIGAAVVRILAVDLLRRWNPQNVGELALEEPLYP
ncbi:SAM-dependent methyltransferase [Sesbania bispinosa]|nr:SAM-dependent methyltransferase [Sesbania bispinosa]